MTKRLGFLIFVVLAAITLYNCRKDVVIEPPPSLVGIYSGTYAREVQNEPDSVPVNQHIIWTFTDTKYYMDYDQSYYNDPILASVCDCGGEYAVTSGIYLQAQTSLDSNRTHRICKKDYAPDGQYQLDQSVAGQVTMTSLTQSGGKSVLRTIHLTKTQ